MVQNSRRACAQGNSISNRVRGQTESVAGNFVKSGSAGDIDGNPYNVIETIVQNP
jgi:hypothetical protein